MLNITKAVLLFRDARYEKVAVVVKEMSKYNLVVNEVFNKVEELDTFSQQKKMKIGYTEYFFLTPDQLDRARGWYIDGAIFDATIPMTDDALTMRDYLYFALRLGDNPICITV